MKTTFTPWNRLKVSAASRLLMLIFLTLLLASSTQAQAPVDDSALAHSICVVHPHALKGITILLDAGHGGDQLGAHFGPVQEKTITLAVTLKLKARLEGMGAKVYMTRTTDTDITLEGRVNRSIALRPDIFISVHANANRHTSIYGIETYYYGKRSSNLAATLLRSVSQGLQEKPNWKQQERLFVCHHNIVPSTLVEIGYLSNARTVVLLTTDSYQERAAESIAVGVFNYFQQPGAARGCILSNKAVVQVVQDMKDGLTARSRHLSYRHKRPHLG
jgi:N-acetylmuramoyl-L-alanine amidase